MRCEDRGPDLLARTLRRGAAPAPSDAPASAQLEAHLASCAACRDEAARLERDVRAAAAEPAPAAPASLRRRLLAAVADEAAERRTEAAVAAARSCEGLREDAVLHGVGALSPAESPRVEAHLAACAPCADEHRAARRMASAHRDAVRGAVPVGLRTRVLDAVRADRLADAPPPPPRLRLVEMRRARDRARLLSFAVPLAAAAALLVAIWSLSPSVGLHVTGEDGAILHSCEEEGSAAPIRIDRGTGEVRLAVGSGVEAGERPVDVRLRFAGRAAGDADARPSDGEVRVRLHPRTRLDRTGDAEFELATGRVTVHAGRLDKRLAIRHGAVWAKVVGTRFDVAVVGAGDGAHLVVAVGEGRVEVGRDGPVAASVLVDGGEAALVDATRLLRRTAGAAEAVDAFLAPRVGLSVAAARVARGESPVLVAELSPGDAGPVTVNPLDDSDPRFVVRLKGPDGRELQQTVRRSMLVGDGGAPVPDPSAGPAPTVRLEEGRPYRVRFRLAVPGLEPGRWEARLRYQSYGTRPDGTEWHGTVESDAVPFEVMPE